MLLKYIAQKGSLCVHVEEFKNKNALINFNEAGCRGELIKWSIHFVYGPLELVC